MTESLKAARDRLGRELVERITPHDEIGRGWYREAVKRARTDLRELQRQAMEVAIRRVASIQAKHGLRLHVEAFSAAELDWVLDEPPPHHPPRCIRCGLHEGIGHPGNHPFVPQSPRCHRAHPHSEPCERERQAALESRGWDGRQRRRR